MSNEQLISSENHQEYKLKHQYAYAYFQTESLLTKFWKKYEVVK
jgi:hypothetical protein